MSPQHSNRDRLIEGTIRCLESLPPEKITARAIAAESEANLASIGYHFGSKDALVTEAVTRALDRWLAEIGAGLATVEPGDPPARLRAAAGVVEATRRRHAGLARGFLFALARAQHAPEVRAILVDGFRRTRPALAAVLGLGGDRAGEDAAGLVLAMFDGLLFQALLDDELAIEGTRMQLAQERLGEALPTGS